MQKSAKYIYYSPVFNYESSLIFESLILICFFLPFSIFQLQSCRALVKAYGMNLLIHFPGYSFSIPLLLTYAVYKTRSIWWAFARSKHVLTFIKFMWIILEAVFDTFRSDSKWCTSLLLLCIWLYLYVQRWDKKWLSLFA